MEKNGKLLEHSMARHGQDHHLRSLWEFDSHRVRVAIKLDSSFIAQSFAKAEIWTGHWENVALLHYSEDPHPKAVSLGEIDKEALKGVERALIKRTLWTLGGTFK